MKKRIRILLPLTILWSIAWLLYYPALSGGYIWDDSIIFQGITPLIHGPLLWDTISRPVLPGGSYFRPLVFFSWFAEFHLFGQKPVVSHAVNIIIFCINIALLYLLTLSLAEKWQLSKPFLRALAAALLYLVHPALVETSAWTSGRFDQMAALFILAGLLVFVRSFRGFGRKLPPASTWAIGICFLGALMSKELGLIFPLLLLTCYFAVIFREKPEISYKTAIMSLLKKYWFTILLLLLIFSVYMILRTTAIGNNREFSITTAYMADTYGKLIPFYALEYYLRLAFLPFFKLQLLYPFSDLDYSLTGKLTAAAFGIGVLAVCISAFAAKTRLCLWIAFCAFTSVSLVLYVIPLNAGDSLITARFLTLPLAFVCMAVALIAGPPSFVRPRIFSSMVLLVFMLWTIGAAANTRNVIGFWKSDFSLWTWAAKGTSIQSSGAAYNYIIVLMENNEPQKAKKFFEEHIRNSGRYPDKNAPLKPNDQLVFASILLRNDDPESLKYFEGLAVSLPEYYKSTMSKRDLLTHTLVMNPYAITDTYLGYADALAIFENNPEKALKQTDIALWYAPTANIADKTRLLKASLAYITGNRKAAYDAYDRQKLISANLENKKYLFIPQYIYKYCAKWQEQNKQCNFFKNDKYFDDENTR